MTDLYKTIKSQAEGIYKEKGSRFLSFAVPVQTADETKEIIRNFRKQYYDARHVCYAYMLGAERREWRANDDGEPSGTAGNPILGQINSKELTNILVVVVRYFGGILLGTGGLAAAYKKAAGDALSRAEIIEKTVVRQISVRFEYPLANEVMRAVKDARAEISEQHFDSSCSLKLHIRRQDTELLISRLEKIQGVTVEKER